MLKDELKWTQRRENYILEGAVPLHCSFELIKCDLSIAVGIHPIENLIELSGFHYVCWETFLRQRLHSSIQYPLILHWTGNATWNITEG